MDFNIANPQLYQAGLYIRLSKEDDKDDAFESQSIINQRSLLQSFVQKNNLTVVEEYVDEGFSGTSFERPGFQRLLEDIANKRINMLLTKDMSRLGRDYIMTGYYLEKFFPENRVRYISLLDGVDTGVNSTANDITPFKAILNDMYAKDISNKIKSVKRDKQKKGLFIGPKASYGYQISPEEKNKLLPDPPAASVVKRIFQLASEDISARHIAICLNKEKIPPPGVYAGWQSEGKWSAEAVARILKNRMYIGDMVQGRSRKLSYKSKKEIKLPAEEWVVVENTHQPIIELAEFTKIQTLLESRRRIRRRTYNHWLKGLIYCRECGHPLGVIRRELANCREVFYFICRTYQRFGRDACGSHNFREDLLRQALGERLRALPRLSPRDIDEVYGQVMAQLQKEESKQQGSQALKKRLQALSISIDKLYSDKSKGILADEDFLRIYTGYQEERSSLRAKIQRQKEEKENLAAKDLLSPREWEERFWAEIEENRELWLSLVSRLELRENGELFMYYACKPIANNLQ